MTCRQIDQLLCDYLDGALPFEQQRAFEQHLEACPACTETLTETELALGFVRSAPRVEAPIELIADIIHDTIGVRGTLPVLAPAGGMGGVGPARLAAAVLQPAAAAALRDEHGDGGALAVDADLLRQRGAR